MIRDYFIKWVKLYALPNESGDLVAEMVEKGISYSTMLINACTKAGSLKVTNGVLR